MTCPPNDFGHEQDLHSDLVFRLTPSTQLCLRGPNQVLRQPKYVQEKEVNLLMATQCAASSVTFLALHESAVSMDPHCGVHLSLGKSTLAAGLDGAVDGLLTSRNFFISRASECGTTFLGQGEKLSGLTFSNNYPPYNIILICRIILLRIAAYLGWFTLVRRKPRPNKRGDLHCLDGKEVSQDPGNIPSEVDVLIIGSGPAGLALAAQLSQFSDISTCLVEQKSERLTLGQADGLQCRSLEMFEAFGFSERVLKEAYWVNETTFWKPNENDRTKIARSGRIRDTEEGLSEFPHVILNQARVHDFFLDVMRRSPTGMIPKYSRRLLDLKMLDDEKTSQLDYPVEVRLEKLGSGHESEIETTRARYVVGCEGSRSTVRKSLGLSLEGDSANQAWGVMDVLAVTNFPDYRTKTAIHSADQGSILIIPREGGYLVRLYIELDKLNADERVANRNITADHLVGAAQRILHPYTLDVKEVVWWSVYEIGQRLCNRFDDVPEDEKDQRLPHIFIAGDACHTHSPKAGQGMNVSMQDGFNLGWKLASVIRGQATPDILRTYSKERQAVAEELIEFDREFARMFSARPKDSTQTDGEGIDPAEFQKYFQKAGRFTAGFGTNYAPSLITAKPRYQHLATGFPVGARFHSEQVLRLADAKPMQLGHAVKADGRWRLFAFAGDEDPAAPSSRLAALCQFLAESSQSPFKRYTPHGADIDSVIDLRAIVQQSHASLGLDAMPGILWPQKGKYGLHDYEKIYCGEEVDGRPDIFSSRGIDRKDGCVVVVRPDQYVANVLPLDAHETIAAFFAEFMIEA